MESGRSIHRARRRRFLVRRSFHKKSTGPSASISRRTSTSLIRMLDSSASRKYTRERRKEKLQLLRTVKGYSRTCKQSRHYFATLIPPYGRLMDQCIYATTNSFTESCQMEKFRHWPIVR